MKQDKVRGGGVVVVVEKWDEGVGWLGGVFFSFVFICLS